MRWPWQRPTPPPTTIPNERPDLWTDEEWAWEMERDRQNWQRIMEPALQQFEQAEQAMWAAMGLPAPPPIPRPDFVREAD